MDIIRYAQREELRKASKVHLIAVGDVPAIRADEVKPGMKIIFNYGKTLPVLGVEYRGGWVYLKITDQFTRKHRPSTLVPVVGAA